MDCRALLQNHTRIRRKSHVADAVTKPASSKLFSCRVLLLYQMGKIFQILFVAAIDTGQ
jgi:hypothetical protein